MKNIDKKYIKKTSHDLAQRSINGIYTYLIAWWIVAVFSSVTSYNLQLVHSVGLAITCIGILRLLLVKFFEPLQTKHPNLWRNLFGIGMIFSASIWSLFTAWSFYQVGLTDEAVILFLPIVLLSSGGIVSLSPSRKYLVLFLSIITIPQLVVFISMVTANAYIIAFMFVCFELFLLDLGLKINQDYWELLETNEDNIRLYANVFENSGEAIIITDKNNNIISINKAMRDSMGYSLEELKGKNPNILKSKYTSEKSHQEMWQSLKETGYWQGDLWNRTKSGEILPKWAFISVIRNKEGEISNHIASYSELSKRKHAGERINELAYHDSLTGLLNRMSLESRAKQALLSAQRNRKSVAFFFIDMDRFKNINDTLGHAIGDELLIEVSKRLKKSVRESDIVARQGGDEFVVVLTDLDDPMLSSAIATFIVHCLSQPYHIKSHTLNSSPSLGISLFPNDGKDVNTLLKHADSAMYHAKEKGRNNYQFFTHELNLIAAERAELENELNLALENKQFTLFYQPKVSGPNGNIIGFEALIRWIHPKKGLIPPDKFISICEENKFIIPLGGWVIREACQQLENWHTQGFTKLTMAINLSLQQFQAQDFIPSIEEELKKYTFSPSQIEFEITESTAMFEPEMIIEKLKTIKQFGVKLAIDDFGTGYSSLAYLKRLPIDTLKIDKTFVSNLEKDSSDAKICAATIALAHSLGLKVVAEGVETVLEKEFLINHHCEFLQGFLFSRPLPVDEAFQYLQKSYCV